MNDTITNWRDLSGLTKAQRDRLVLREDLFLSDGRPADIVEAFLLHDAMAHVTANIVDNERFGHIPDPAGATYLFHWRPNENTGNWEREFEVKSWRGRVGRFCLDILGTQHADGTAAYRLVVNAPELEFNSTGAQVLVEAVTAASVELDRLNGGAR
jgi:hypothetical protein